MAEAVGILEVFGLATAFVAGDAGCKAANVRLEVFDKNKPANADSLPVPLLVWPGDDRAGGGVPPQKGPVHHQKNERISRATITAPTTPQKPMPS